ncbi:hypothetical protein CC80DRAFT_48845 [Byssothecium circinans]|uniref:Uncharacterized protein n=1 Tax=Byssothecium circinans TaxID=147558 RepID=A0A6A5U042_9PLEO|nr:hypothetical protein CC80DRAFT_48845 [Byssothecium circinans]
MDSLSPTLSPKSTAWVSSQDTNQLPESRSPRPTTTPPTLASPFRTPLLSAIDSMSAVSFESGEIVESSPEVAPRSPLVAEVEVKSLPQDTASSQEAPIHNAAVYTPRSETACNNDYARTIDDAFSAFEIAGSKTDVDSTNTEENITPPADQRGDKNKDMERNLDIASHTEKSGSVVEEHLGTEVHRSVSAQGSDSGATIAHKQGKEANEALPIPQYVGTSPFHKPQFLYSPMGGRSRRNDVMPEDMNPVARGWPAQQPRPGSGGLGNSMHANANCGFRGNGYSGPTRQELLAELATVQKSQESMRRDIQAEVEKTTEGALHAMLGQLLHKQSTVIRRTADLQAKDIDLTLREERCKQLEEFLATGQTHFWLQADGKQMSVANAELLRVQGENDARRQLQTQWLNLEVREKLLKVQQNQQEFRERQYQARIRPSLEGMLRASLEPEIEERVSQVAYDEGFAAGKEAAYAAARAESHQALQDAAFFEGYKACRKAMENLQLFRAEKSSVDSVEVESLVNSSQSEGLFDHSKQIVEPVAVNRVKGATVKEVTVPVDNGVENMAADGMNHVEEAHKVEPEHEAKQQERDTPIPDLLLFPDHDAPFSPSSPHPPSSKTSSSPNEKNSKAPLPRRTLFQELNKEPARHNGHVVLANGAATARNRDMTDGRTNKEPEAVRNNGHAVLANSTATARNQDMSYGRTLLSYADSDDERRDSRRSDDSGEERVFPRRRPDDVVHAQDRSVDISQWY